MRAEELIHLIRHKPFRPLRLHMAVGDAYDIHSPENIIVSKQSVHVGVVTDENSGVVDRTDYISLGQIVSVQAIPVEPSNGSCDV